MSSSPILPTGAEVRPWDWRTEAAPGSQLAARGESTRELAGKRVDPELDCEPRAASCEQERSDLLAEAREECARLRAAAEERGYAEGQARAQEEVSLLQEQLRLLLASVPDAYHRYCEEQAPALAELAILAAELVLRDQLAIDPGRVVVGVRAALEHVAASSRITIHLNPGDLDLVRAEVADGMVPQPLLRADPSIEPGGCRLESEHGEVDATLSGCLERLRVMIRETIGARDEG